MDASNRQGQRRLRAPLTAALLAIALLGQAAAQSGPEIAPGLTASELYLLDVHAGDTKLGESLPAFSRGDVFFIEIGALTASLEFPLARVDNTWSGWFFSQDRSFSWDMAAARAAIGDGEPETVDPANWREAAGEVFVADFQLEHWFGIEIEINERKQLLSVSADELLPFELRRERTLARYRFRAAERFEPDVVVPDQYAWATQPLFNFDSQIMARSNDGQHATSGTTSIAAGMDLLKHSVVFSGSYTRNADAASTPIEAADSPVEPIRAPNRAITAPTDATRRLTVERFAATPDTPIFADIHHYAFGDIFESRPNLITVPNTGRGFTFDRYADSRTGNLSAVTIADIAPPGWEVELYRNGVLIDFAAVGTDGRYVFADQELYFGENEFVARLYGPQGQTREDRRTYFGGGIELDPGDYDYSVSHIDYSEHLLDGRPNNYASLPASYATELRYSRALSADVEIGGAYTRTGLATRDRDGTFLDQDYLSLFGRARLGPGVLVGEAVGQLDAGRALSLEYLSGIAGTTLSFAQRIYDEFESPATLQSQPLDTFTEFSALGSFGLRDQNGYRAGIRRRGLSDGSTDTRLFGRIGSRAGPLSLTNELEYRVDGGQNALLGLVRLAGRVRNLSIRGQIDYSLSRSTPVRQISTSMNWDISRRLNNNFTISRNFDSTGGTYASNIVSVRVRNFDLSFGATSDFDRNWSVAAGVSFAFGFDARQRAFMTDYQSLAHTGRATMNVFVDHNNNGIRDPGETTVESAVYRGQSVMAAAPGSVTLTALPSESAVQIDTGRFEFDDPFLIPSLRSYELRTHAGSDIEIDIPVVLTGDVEGTLLDGAGRPARGIELLLLDGEGAERGVTQTAFDGYYSFTGIPGGRYRIALRHDDGEIESLLTITLDAEQGFVTAPDITLSANAATARAVEAGAQAAPASPR